MRPTRDEGRSIADRVVTRRDLLRAGTILPLIVPAVAACGGGGLGRRTAPSTTPGTSGTTHPSTTRGPATTIAARGPYGRGQPVTLAFAGDTHFIDQWDTEGGAVYTGVPSLAQQLAADPLHVLAPIAPVLSRADLAMVNLETAITDRGTPVPGKAYHFRSPPEAFVALKAAGADVVTMANNHALDYGPVGLDDTFEAIAASGLPVVGLGHDAAEAFRPYRTTIHGQRIAIFGAVDWLEPALVDAWTATDHRPGLAFSIDPTRLLQAVAGVRPEVDTVVIFLHWGIEDTHCASPEQSSLARALVAAGADLVVGSHAHRVFGAGHLGAALVAYGLGNFVYWREDGESGSSGVLLVTVTGRRIDGYTWVPARIVHGIPIPESGPAATADLDQWAIRRVCSALTP